jgi:hypothetical protein
MAGGRRCGSLREPTPRDRPASRTARSACRMSRARCSLRSSSLSTRCGARPRGRTGPPGPPRCIGRHDRHPPPMRSRVTQVESRPRQGGRTGRRSRGAAPRHG